MVVNLNEERNHRAEGSRGEKIACDYLESKGYSIICRNYYTAHGEIDIIAEDSGHIVFIEVKTRKNSPTRIKKYGRPARAIDYAKKEHILFSVREYIRLHESSKKPRIDVIEVLTDTIENGFHSAQIKHFENAIEG